MMIGGEEVDGTRSYPIKLPYDRSVQAEVQEGDRETLNAAMEAAVRAAPLMKAMPSHERSDLLFRVRDLLLRSAEEMAKLLVSESGKPITEARTEVARGTQTLLFSAMAARDLRGEAIPMDAAPGGEGKMALTTREPLGVIAAITPFNLPLNLALHKVAPAVAGGNTVVHKPSEVTPLSALYLAKLFMEAGAPAGAYNVITGDGEAIGRALVADERVAMITFTGSREVGKEIRAAAGLKKVTLELGGNSPVIVCEDADLELAAARCVAGAFGHSGQVCISVQRISVHESVADNFIERLKSGAEALQIGEPFAESTQISSLISEDEARRVMEWIGEAVRGGARLVCGGQRSYATVRPTVLADVPEDARVICLEAFGPVVCVNRYSDLPDAVARANSTPYGLQAGLFTRDLSRAFSMAHKIEAGGVMINEIPGFRVDQMPYGGVKESGMGREGPRYAIEEMTEAKLICWR
ncbi:MAG: aldehyde dehydrogenase family protein [Bryobacteraceae bacterium]|nr:aldehyde dehydrogenase family protein [Bryobacteraceae bacterium]